MEVLSPRCCGLDVHRGSVVACLSIIENGQRRKEVREFATHAASLISLRDWLLSEGCTHVGMESTGVYWGPVYRRLYGFFEQVVANAQHIKAVPGHKTDIKDAEWIADLLQHGLLQPSYVPPVEQQELRELTRLRTTFVQDRARLVNRIHKVLEEAGIKLSSVLTDIMGVSGRAILRALVAGERDPERLANLAHKSLRRKHEQLVAALQSDMQPHQGLRLAGIVSRD